MNTLKIVFRRIQRNQLHFLLSVTTLVLGISSSALILYFVSVNLSFDRFPHSERIFKLYKKTEDQPIAITEGNLKSTLGINIVDIEAITHLMTLPVELTFIVDSNSFAAKNGLLVDADYLGVFNQSILSGNKATMLKTKNSVVLSKAMANRLFKDYQKALGASILVSIRGEQITLVVDGVIDPKQIRSHIHFDFLLSGSTLFFWDESTPYPSFHTYIKVKDDVSKASLQEQISAVVEQNNPKGQQNSYLLESISDIHLSNDKSFELSKGFEKTNLRIIGFTGILIILVTFLNFLNLSNARFFDNLQIKGSGIRNALGASERSISLLNIIETLTIIFVSFGVAVVSILLFRPTIEKYLLMSISPIEFITTTLIFLSVVALVGIGITTAISKRVNQQNVADVLRGRFSTSSAVGRWTRNAFLGIQFTVSLFTIICSIGIVKQIDFLFSRDLGFSFSNIFLLQRPENISLTSWNTFRDQLETESIIENTATSVYPAIGEYNTLSIQNSKNNTEYNINWIGVDSKYLPTVNLKLLWGRNFDPRLESDGTKLIVNETAFKMLGGDSALSAEYSFPRIKGPAQIIGVVADFNYSSIKEKVAPTALTIGSPMAMRNLLIKTSQAVNLETFENLVRSNLSRAGLIIDFTPLSLEDEFKSRLISEERILRTLLVSFSIISILLSTLGIAGVISYILVRKRKEISVRRVLGASAWSSLLLLNRPLLLVILISSIVGIPAALFAIRSWLEAFLFRTSLTVFDVLLPALGLLVLVFLVSYGISNQVLRSSPTKHLVEE